MSRRALGIEEEFLLLARSGPELAEVGDAVVAGAGAVSDGQFEHELKRSQAELGTTPRVDLTELEDELRQRRAELAAVADRHDARIAAIGTFPGTSVGRTTADRRYRRMDEHFGGVATVQLTCGLHVHVDVDSRDEGVRVIDAVQPWLPVITALSANSPFHDGVETGHASYRTILWGQWPTAGLTQPFGSAARYDATVASLIETGAALDPGMIYFGARLSERYPTVEFRVADVCARVEDAITVAALVRGLVSTFAAAGPAQSSRPELLRTANWRAARWGVDAELVDPRHGRLAAPWTVVDALLERVEPALRDTGDLDRVVSGLASIRGRGTGATLQRAAYANRDLADVTDAVAAATLV